MKMALSEFVLREKGIYGILHVIILILSLFLVHQYLCRHVQGDSLLRTVSLHESTAVDMRSVPG